MSQHPSYKMTDFDTQMTSDTSQMLKALLPYLPPRSQRILGVYAKAMEMRTVLSTSLHGPADLSICTGDTKALPDEPELMLQEISSYCSVNTQKKIEDMLSLFAMIKLSQLLQESEPSQSQEAP